MSDDRVIHLDDYRRADDPDARRGLSLVGAEGDRRHFALPLWRMANTASADWAGIVRWTESGPEATTVLDLSADPARQRPPSGFPASPGANPPDVVETNEGVVLPLGRHGESRWAALLAGRSVRMRAARDELLFLAGECAGLLALLHAEYDVSPSGPSDA